MNDITDEVHLFKKKKSKIFTVKILPLRYFTKKKKIFRHLYDLLILCSHFIEMLLSFVE